MIYYYIKYLDAHQKEQVTMTTQRTSHEKTLFHLKKDYHGDNNDGFITIIKSGETKKIEEVINWGNHDD